MVDRQLLSRDQLVDVEAERCHIARQFVRRFLEGDADPWLVILHCSAREEFDAQQGFSATCAATDQGGPPSRQSAKCNFVQSQDSGWTFRDAVQGKILFLDFWHG